MVRCTVRTELSCEYSGSSYNTKTRWEKPFSICSRSPGLLGKVLGLGPRLVVLVHAQRMCVFVVICEVKRMRIMCSIQIRVEILGVWVEGRVVHTGSVTLSNQN